MMDSCSWGTYLILFGVQSLLCLVDGFEWGFFWSSVYECHRVVPNLEGL